ncbi:MAG: PHP domain-containing protein [Blastocatellia bacterium]|nr:PHP domain-containing protein [Blastocatellia bacterium]
MIIDLHIHTIYSQDSLIAPEDLIEQAISVGLDAVCVMEHNSFQASETAEEFALGTGLKVFREWKLQQI